MKSEEKTNLIQNIFLGFSCIIATISLLLSIYQNKELAQIQYLTKASELKPMLDISLLPEIKELKVQFDRLSSHERIAVILDSLVVKMKFKNNSNKVAKIWGTIYGGSHKGQPFIRDILLKNDVPDKRFEIFNNNDFYKDEVVLPNKDKEFTFRCPIRDIKNNTFVQHYLILFNNDAGMLYDAYIICRYSVKKALCDKENDGDNNKYQLKFDFPEQKICYAIEVEKMDMNISTYTYSHEELISFREVINSYSHKKTHPFETWYNFKAKLDLEHDMSMK